jgi:hypothetical protein
LWFKLLANGGSTVAELSTHNCKIEGSDPASTEREKRVKKVVTFKMEQHALENVSNCLNNNIYYYLETSGGQSFNQYLNAIHFFQHQC